MKICQKSAKNCSKNSHYRGGGTNTNLGNSKVHRVGQFYNYYSKSHNYYSRSFFDINYSKAIRPCCIIICHLWTGDEPGGGPPKCLRSKILGEEKARQDPSRIELCNKAFAEYRIGLAGIRQLSFKPLSFTDPYRLNH